MEGLPRRRIGRSGPEVSALSLGSWHTYDRMDFAYGVELLRRAVDAGIDFFDVGVYGGVAYEPGGPIVYAFTDVLFARMMERAGIDRDRYQVSAKLWLEEWPDRSFSDQLDNALFRIASERVEFAVLGDIRTDEPDLEGMASELAELVRDGRLGGWGVNNWSIANIRRLHEFATAESLPGPQLAQFQYSLCRRTVAEGEPFRTLHEETGISLEASNVFEGGILAGKLHSDRNVGHAPGGLREAIVEAVPAVERLAAEFDATPAQLGIAFCLDNPALATVLVGVSRLEQLEENLAGVELYRRHGPEIRERVGELWLDRDVDPAGE